SLTAFSAIRPYLFFFSPTRPTRHLHSFPTRRSSDLTSMIRAPVSCSNRRLVSARSGDAPETHSLTDEKSTLPARTAGWTSMALRSEEHTSELQSLAYLVCRLLLEKKKNH